MLESNLDIWQFSDGMSKRWAEVKIQSSLFLSNWLFLLVWISSLLDGITSRQRSHRGVHILQLMDHLFALTCLSLCLRLRWVYEPVSLSTVEAERPALTWAVLSPPSRLWSAPASGQETPRPQGASRSVTRSPPLWVDDLKSPAPVAVIVLPTQLKIPVCFWQIWFYFLFFLGDNRVNASVIPLKLGCLGSSVCPLLCPIMAVPSCLSSNFDRAVRLALVAVVVLEMTFKINSWHLVEAGSVHLQRNGIKQVNRTVKARSAGIVRW